MMMITMMIDMTNMKMKPRWARLLLCPVHCCHDDDDGNDDGHDHDDHDAEDDDHDEEDDDHDHEEEEQEDYDENEKIILLLHNLHQIT